MIRKSQIIENEIKYSIFRQENNTTCGVACLRMAMAFFGEGVEEFELEEACETGWLGNTCGELVKCVRKYGFEAEEVENIAIDYIKTNLRKNHPVIAQIGRSEVKRLRS